MFLVVHRGFLENIHPYIISDGKLFHSLLDNHFNRNIVCFYVNIFDTLTQRCPFNSCTPSFDYHIFSCVSFKEHP